MAKELFYYRMTPTAWAAAQARGYLLESSHCGHCPYGSCTKSAAECESHVRTWTNLMFAREPVYWLKPSYFGNTAATICLQVMYERKSDDARNETTLLATGHIPLSDVTPEERTMEDSKELIGELHKNSLEVVKVHVSWFRGKVYVDARVYCQDEGKNPGVIIATKKGLCLTPDLVLELLPLLSKAQERAAELAGGKR